MHTFQADIERYYNAGTLSGEQAEEARRRFAEFREALTQGRIRAAEKRDGQWRVNPWVKQGILLGFRLG
ncbi:MAG TPA: 2,3,4,5-tetrahydropyridine-2,6-dicarboxylate N-succinyltransferase, partial [Terriglobales bacterium]|nr:2,3,4,5-tetrahydropyridine-2,6-dicarboxylate N-succinyltransferase [Terriglobales bacterium]